MTIKDEIEDFLRKFGVFKVRVADPELGFRMVKVVVIPEMS